MSCVRPLGAINYCLPLQWWAGRGHRKVRQCPVWPVRPTPFSPSPARLVSVVWWFKTKHTGGCLIATILTQTHAFFAIPFDSTTDFTVLAGLLFDLVVYFADE